MADIRWVADNKSLRDFEEVADEILEGGDVYERKSISETPYDELNTEAKWQYALETVNSRQGKSYQDPGEIIRDYALEQFDPTGSFEDNLDNNLRTKTRSRDLDKTEMVCWTVNLFQKGRKEEGIKMARLIDKTDLV